jgi:cytidine deaminase
MGPKDASERNLAEAAWRARDGAICPHSGFAVGAALEDGDGRIWSGANVETDSFNLGLCAERVALFSALVQGGRAFRRMVVATDTERPTPPCGACAQILRQFAADAELLLVTRGGETTRLAVRDLLPYAFELPE